MKCPGCSNNHPKKEGRTCVHCGYEFVFDKATDGVTDGLFVAMLKKTSRADTYYFTENQLYGTWVNRKPSQDSQVGGGCLITVGGAVMLGILLSESPQLFFIGLILIVGGVLMFRTRPSAPSRQELSKLVKKWLGAGRPAPKLLQRPSLEKSPGPYREKDIFDYGVERIFVVDDPLLVDLFVNNGIHAEQRALVVTLSYPQQLLSLVEKLLAERPDLPVVVFHAATPKGFALLPQVQRAPQFRAATQIVDGGLSESQVRSSQALKRVQAQSTQGEVFLDSLAMPALLAGVASVAVLGVADFAQAAQPGGSLASGGGDFG